MPCQILPSQAFELLVLRPASTAMGMPVTAGTTVLMPRPAAVVAGITTATSPTTFIASTISVATSIAILTNQAK